MIQHINYIAIPESFASKILQGTPMSRSDKSQIILDFKKQRIESPKDWLLYFLLKLLCGTHNSKLQI